MKCRTFDNIRGYDLRNLVRIVRLLGVTALTVNDNTTVRQGCRGTLYSYGQPQPEIFLFTDGTWSVTHDLNVIAYRKSVVGTVTPMMRGRVRSRPSLGPGPSKGGNGCLGLAPTTVSLRPDPESPKSRRLYKTGRTNPRVTYSLSGVGVHCDQSLIDFGPIHRRVPSVTSLRTPVVPSEGPPPPEYRLGLCNSPLAEPPLPVHHQMSSPWDLIPSTTSRDSPYLDLG